MIVARKCPNCDAPLSHNYNHKCSYCGTFIDLGVGATKELDPKYMRNVKVKGIELTPVSYSVIVLFEGDYVPYVRALEYGENNNVFVVNKDELMGKKMYFRIDIPINDLRSPDFDANHILAFLPFEMETEELLKALWEFKKEQRWI